MNRSFQELKQALTGAGATVICHNKTIRTVACASLRRRVAKELTAQGGATIQTCVKMGK